MWFDEFRQSESGLEMVVAEIKGYSKKGTNSNILSFMLGLYFAYPDEFSSQKITCNGDDTLLSPQMTPNYPRQFIITCKKKLHT